MANYYRNHSTLYHISLLVNIEADNLSRLHTLCTYIVYIHMYFIYDSIFLYNEIRQALTDWQTD